MAKWFIIAGTLLVVVGALLHFVPSAFSWFGRLPGDIRYESGNTRVFIPITSMVVISIVLSIVVSVLRK